MNNTIVSTPKRRQPACRAVREGKFCKNETKKTSVILNQNRNAPIRQKVNTHVAEQNMPERTKREMDNLISIIDNSVEIAVISAVIDIYFHHFK